MNYINFIEKYKSKLKEKPTNIEYENICEYIEKIVNKSIMDNNYPPNYSKITTEFTTAYMLSIHSPKELLSNKYENIAYAVSKKFLLSTPKKNIIDANAKNYVKKKVNSIIGIFEENVNTEEVAKNIYDNLIFNGRNDTQIINGLCDDEMYIVISDGYANCKFDKEFEKFKSYIFDQTDICFNRNKFEILRIMNNESYKDTTFGYYSNSYFLRLVSYKIACNLYMSGYNTNNIDRVSINSKIQDYINYEIMKHNSTNSNKKNSMPKYSSIPKKEKKMSKEELKKKIIIYAIIIGCIAAENIIYNATHNNSKKENKPQKPITVTEVSSPYIPGSYWDKIYEDHNMEVKGR